MTPGWAELAASATLAAELEPGGTHIAVMLHVGPVPPALAGRKLRLCLGETALMTVPLRATGAALTFGPARLTPMEAERHAAEPPRLQLDGASTLAPAGLTAEVAEALATAAEEEVSFLERVQRPDSRFRRPLALRFAARADHGPLPDVAQRAAALIRQARSLLDRDLARLSAEDRALAARLRAEGKGLVEEGLRLLAAPAPREAELRWTVPLAMNCALLSLCQDEPGEANLFLGAAAAQAHLIHLAPAAALDLMMACLLLGVLRAQAQDREAAREVLGRGVRAFQPCVAAQDVMAGPEVMDDIIRVARAARLCFAALGRFGLRAEAEDAPRSPSDAGLLDLRHASPPLHRILAAGLCPSLAEALAALTAGDGQAPD